MADAPDGVALFRALDERCEMGGLVSIRTASTMVKVGVAQEPLNTRYSPTALMGASYLTALATRMDSFWVRHERGKESYVGRSS